MVQTKLIKQLLVFIALLVFITIFGIGIIFNAPISHINKLLKPRGIQVKNLFGDVGAGKFSNIVINNKNYSLQCKYDKQSWLSYKLHCDSPFAIDMLISFSIFKLITVTNATIKGQIQDSKDWMQLLEIPDGIFADVSLNINEAIFSGAKSNIGFVKLDLLGSADNLRFYEEKILDNISIITKHKTTQIIIDTVANDEFIKLFLETKIDKNNYITKGFIKGEDIAVYSNILGFFGRQVAYDEWSVEMNGNFIKEALVK